MSLSVNYKKVGSICAEMGMTLPQTIACIKEHENDNGYIAISDINMWADSVLGLNGLKAMPFRFFKIDLNDETSEIEQIEITEKQFLIEFANASESVKIEYERHTVYANGVRQVCLTINDLY